MRGQKKGEYTGGEYVMVWIVAGISGSFGAVVAILILPIAMWEVLFLKGLFCIRSE
jgi:hypothetical protein